MKTVKLPARVLLFRDVVLAPTPFELYPEEFEPHLVAVGPLMAQAEFRILRKEDTENPIGVIWREKCQAQRFLEREAAGKDERELREFCARTQADPLIIWKFAVARTR